MLLIRHDSSFTARTVNGDSAAWLEEMEQRGVRKHGDRLRPAAEAKTVRMRDGELLVQRGQNPARFRPIKRLHGSAQLFGYIWRHARHTSKRTALQQTD
jgi:hypothetical protein